MSTPLRACRPRLTASEGVGDKRQQQQATAIKNGEVLVMDDGHSHKPGGITAQSGRSPGSRTTLTSRFPAGPRRGMLRSNLSPGTEGCGWRLNDGPCFCYLDRGAPRLKS